MAAMAHDLRRVAPDLAGQFEESLPGTRRNTGSGLFTAIIVNSRRPLSVERATGRFGTVHAMVGALPDPIAFQVELLNGRLVALHGDAYGLDTRAVDFARVPYDQVFTVNDRGDSIAFEPAALMPPGPLTDLQRHAEPAQPAPPRTLVNVGPLQRLQDTEPVPAPSLIETLLAPAPAGAAPLDKDEKISLIIGLWVAIAAAGFIAVVVFDIPIVFAGVLGIFAGRALQTPKGLALVKRGMEAYRRARAERSA